MKGVRPLGYTIVEVMIVLAVSGMMFVIAANFINGKQERASFTAGVNEMAGRLEDVIQQVTDGQYSDVPLHCTFGMSTSIVPGSLTDQQGNQAPCVFLGKIMHFQELPTLPADNWPTTDNKFHYEVLSVGGGRINAAGAPIVALTGVAGAKPAVADTITKQQTVPQSLNVRKVTLNGAATTSYGIGFFQSQGTSDGAGGVKTGAQSVFLYYLTNLDSIPPGAGTNRAAAIGKVSTGALAQASRVDICLTDGTQYATITLGTNNNALTVSVKRNGTTAPAAPIC